jgi:hypothetical protein
MFSTGSRRTLQVMHPLLTFGRLALALFALLNSPSGDVRLYNSIGVGCTGIRKYGFVCLDIAKEGWCCSDRAPRNRRYKVLVLVTKLEGLRIGRHS